MVVLNTDVHHISDTSSRLKFIQTISWSLNFFGAFFILAAHEHYTIDVIVAFYITSRTFAYYHVLANSLAHKQRNSQVIAILISITGRDFRLKCTL